MTEDVKFRIVITFLILWVMVRAWVHYRKDNGGWW